MIFYKPISEKRILEKYFSEFDFSVDSIYGGYIGIDEEGMEVGKCLMSINGYYSYILLLDCDYSDKLLVEGFLRSALNYCANRNAYMSYCKLEDISDVLLHLGYENNNGVYSGDIPSLLKGSCCK